MSSLVGKDVVISLEEAPSDKELGRVVAEVDDNLFQVLVASSSEKTLCDLSEIVAVEPF